MPCWWNLMKITYNKNSRNDKYNILRAYVLVFSFMYTVLLFINSCHLLFSLNFSFYSRYRLFCCPTICRRRCMHWPKSCWWQNNYCYRRKCRHRIRNSKRVGSTRWSRHHSLPGSSKRSRSCVGSEEVFGKCGSGFSTAWPCLARVCAQLLSANNWVRKAIGYLDQQCWLVFSTEGSKRFPMKFISLNTVTVTLMRPFADSTAPGRYIEI